MAQQLATRKLTQPDMILVAFYRASGGTTTKVPYEELVLQAWRDFPQEFSLRNHPEHPDASDIHKKLYYGPLKSEGLVVPLGGKVFRLTDKGLQRARSLATSIGNGPAPKGERGKLARDQESFINHAVRSRVFEAWRAGERDGLVDYDARLFFQFSTGTSPKERKRKAQFARETIERAAAIGVPEAAELRALMKYLLGRFERLFQEG
jgi:hypothetical protein